MAKRVLCMSVHKIHAAGRNERTYSTSLDVHATAVGGNEPSLPHLWLCTYTLMAKRVLCMSVHKIHAVGRNERTYSTSLDVHATDSWGGGNEPYLSHLWLCT